MIFLRCRRTSGSEDSSWMISPGRHGLYCNLIVIVIKLLLIRKWFVVAEENVFDGQMVAGNI